MKDYALYFMPDISGFTNFVTNTEIEHSKHIISELLEILLDSNFIGLKLVEIEGDALFMYTTEFPDFADLVSQSKQMLDDFSKHVQRYNTNRICECGACVSAKDLEVKFLIHYGEISFMRVKNIVKPYGADVIKIHRLLKNSIPSDQYLLISQDTLDFYEVKDEELKDFTITQDVYDYGTSQYAYAELKSAVVADEIEVARTVKPVRPPEINFQFTAQTDVDSAVMYISDLSRRTEWYKLVENLKFDDFRINQAGTSHQCLVGDEVFNVKTLKWETQSNERGYGERTSDMPGIDMYQHYITLRSQQDETVVNIEVFIDFNEHNEIRKEQIEQLTSAWQLSISILENNLNNLVIA